MLRTPFMATLICGAALQAAPDEPVLTATAILEQRCLQCHGPSTRSGGLDLSSRAGALKGGSRGPALAPTDPDGSLLLARIANDEMPPGSPLKAGERQTLRDWIASGAEWQQPISEHRAGLDWWSLQPIRKPAPVRTESAPPNWQQTAIDQWIFAGLAAAGLGPAPQAGRRELIRRLSYTLTGLPPEPERVEAFLHDASSNAYETLVDSFLASPHYGERWARHWLDLVRFAESEGFERDLPREHAWPYRDYLIRSFNSDKPYRQFAIEQLAGDVAEPVTHDSIVATTMLTLGPVDAVGLTSAIPEERALIREDLLEDMLGTVTQTFLGLTVNCARCHDHKFDPIRQEEYYQMKAAFQAVWPPTKPVPEAGLDIFLPHGRPLLTPPEKQAREVRIADIERRLQQIGAELGTLFRSVRPADVSGGAPEPLARWTFDVDGRADFAPLHLRFLGKAEARGGAFRKMPGSDDSSGRSQGDQDDPASVTDFGVSELIEIEIGEKTLEVWLEVDSVPEKAQTIMEIRSLSGYRGASVDGIRFVPGESPHWENYSIGQFRSQDPGGPDEALEPGRRVHTAIAYRQDGTIAIFRDGQLYGNPYKPDPAVPAGRLQIYSSRDALVRFEANQHIRILEARLYDDALSPDQVRASYEAGIENLDAKQLEDRLGPKERERVGMLEGERERLHGELAGLPKPRLAFAASIRPDGPTHVLIRGNVDQLGKQVWPAGLSCVQGLRADLGLAPGASEGSRRLAAAEWIANPSNPLFARVIVNRVWQQHFGRGFVANASDLGYNGGQPSHPELLDWLASDFIRQGWSLKALHKRILMSQAFRQSSRFNPEAAARDADNRLLWRYLPRRLDGESVRDSMLAVSGDLNNAIGGPSFRPFEYGEARGSLKRYMLTQADTADHRRRTVYRMNIITAGDPMLEALDCPLPAVKTPQRRSTTTALQALSLMNSAFVQQRVEGFSERLRSYAQDVDGRIRRAFALAYGRLPSDREMASTRPLVRDHGLKSLCWGILNSSEFLYVQ